VESAIVHLKGGFVNKAKLAIDAATINPLTSEDPSTWHYRGFIYKEFAKSQTGTEIWNARQIAFNSFKKSMELDKEATYIDDNKQNIKYLGSLYNNEASKNISPEKYEIAKEFHANYIKCMQIADPAFNPTPKQNEFYLASASMFNRIYESDRKKYPELLLQIEDFYQKVLANDSSNYTANYNLGLHFYNQAVHIINEMEYDLDLIALNDIEEKTVVLFKKALPYMVRANRLYPGRKETLIGLQGIYFSLNDFEKSNAMKMELDKLK
jgi:hypothetical protein